MKTENAPAAVLLAAGVGRRFGANKLLCPISGRPMFRHVYDNLRLMQKEGRIGALYVVTSHQEIEDSVGGEVPVIRNSRPDLGIARSLHLGLAALMEQHPDTEACLFTVGDQPFLGADTLRGFLRSFQESPRGMAACSAEGTAGNPVLFAAEYFPELLALTGDRGGKRVVLRHPEDALFYEVSPDELRDIDTRADVSSFSPEHTGSTKNIDTRADAGQPRGGGNHVPPAPDSGLCLCKSARFTRPGSAEPIPPEEAFPFLRRSRFVVSLCGAGGKTSTMYFLARQCAAAGRRTIVTTTTHIGRPDPALLAESAEDLRRLWSDGSFAVIGADDERAPGRKLRCPDLGRLRGAMRLADCTLIEADGSRRLPSKFPGDHEPVILPETDVVLGVLGLSAVGRPLREICFRAEQAAAFLNDSGIPADLSSPFTPEMAAAILSSDRGTRKGAGNRPYYIVLNQCDDAARRQTAEEICRRLDPGICAGIICSHLRNDGGPLIC